MEEGHSCPPCEESSGARPLGWLVLNNQDGDDVVTSGRLEFVCAGGAKCLSSTVCR
jgi:hypothetical protein